MQYIIVIQPKADRLKEREAGVKKRAWRGKGRIIDMQWDNDYDVKEYRPKKRERSGNAVILPDRLSENQEMRESRMDGGVMMTTAEILDFSEGTDSY